MTRRTLSDGLRTAHFPWLTAAFSAALAAGVAVAGGLVESAGASSAAPATAIVRERLAGRRSQAPGSLAWRPEERGQERVELERARHAGLEPHVTGATSFVAPAAPPAPARR